MPPNLPAGHMLTAQQPPSPPPRWPHLFLGGLPLPPILLPGAGKPALHPFPQGAATPVQRVPYPRPSSWQPAWPPGHLDYPPKCQPLPAKLPVATGTCLGTKSPVGGASPMSISVSASSTSSSIGPSTGRHCSYACTTSWPRADQNCLSTWSALAMHSPGTTSSMYQCLPSPPQFGHLQFGALSGHGTNWEAVGQGTTDTG